MPVLSGRCSADMHIALRLLLLRDGSFNIDVADKVLAAHVAKH